MSYFSLWCNQNHRYMATGLNSSSKEEVKQELLAYLSGDHDGEDLTALAKTDPDVLAGMYEFEIHQHEEKLPE